MRYFCTYFDQHYLNRGLALFDSLRRRAGEFELVVLCMDEAVETALRQRALPGMRLLRLPTLLDAHPTLAAAQAGRSRVEFYFTCTPWLVQHLLPAIPSGEVLTYLDADLYFFSSPEPLYAELAKASVGIIAHRFPPTLISLERFGRYNVGWVSFRHDPTGLACVRDWSNRCAEWCFSRYEAGRYADQKYLDDWPERFANVVSISHPGANVAPWNLKDVIVANGPAGPTVGGQCLIFFHFHALHEIARNLYDPSLHRYDATLTSELRQLIYLPYLQKLHAGDPAGAEPPDVIPPTRPDDSRHGPALQHLLGLLQAAELDRANRLAAIEDLQLQLSNQGMNRHRAEARVVELEHALKGTQDYLQQCEADRESRLKALQEMQRQLEDHGLKRHFAESRLAELEPALKGTQDYLQQSEADRDARLRALQEMQRQLEEHGLRRHLAESRLAELEPALKGTQDYLAQVSADRMAQTEAARSMQTELDRLRAEHDRLLERLRKLEPPSTSGHA